MLRSLAQLDAHATGGPFTGWPTTVRLFSVPTDDVHGALLDLVRSARRSIALAMYSVDDPALLGALAVLCADPNIGVQITLDAGEATQPAEHAALDALAGPWPASTSIAIGHSEHGSLMHLKQLIIDGRDFATGSTNWSRSGQYAQDNDLLVIRNAKVAARAQARLTALHAHILAAQGGTAA